jgi:hypothetical protein
VRQCDQEHMGEMDRGIALGELPSGTVTFLFTVIEGGTERWEHDRAVMAASVARYLVLVRKDISDLMASCSRSLLPPFTRASRRPPKQRPQPSVRRAGARRQPVTREGTRDLCRSDSDPYRARHRSRFR